MPGLEQYVYGWARTGVEGNNRLQVVATSAGWVKEDAYRRVAAQLANIASTQTSNLSSFGWVDRGGKRFVFHRVMTPGIAAGAPGLTAHVIAGDPGELPVSDVLGMYGSPRWWRGEPLDGVVLGAVRGADFLAPDLAPPGQDVVATDAAIRLLMRQGRPLVISSDPDRAHALLRAVGERIPSLLESLSFSTYESGPTMEWFAAMGIADDQLPSDFAYLGQATDPDHPLSGALCEDLESMLRASLNVARYGAVGKPRSQPPRQVVNLIWELAHNRLDLAELLRAKDTLAIVMATDFGAQAVASALWGNTQGSWPSISVLSEHVGPRIAMVATLAGRVCDAEAQVSPGEVCSRFIRLTGSVPDDFFYSVVEQLGAGAAVPACDPTFGGLLLEWAYHHGLRRHDTEVDAVLGYVQPVADKSHTFLQSERVPHEWRRTLYQRAVKAGSYPAQALSTLHQHFPDLASGVLWADVLSPDAVAEFFVRVGPSLRDSVARQLAGTPSGRSLIVQAAARMEAAKRHGLEVEVLRYLPARSLSPADTAIVGDLTWRAVERYLGGDLMHDPLDDWPWRLVDAPSAPDWLTATSRAVRTSVGASLEPWLGTWLHALQLVDRGLQRSLTGFAFAAMVRENLTLASFRVCTAAMGTQAPPARYRYAVIVHALDSRLRHHRTVAVEALAYAIDIAARPGGVIKKPALEWSDTVVRDLLARVDEEQLRDSFHHLGPAGRAYVAEHVRTARQW